MSPAATTSPVPIVICGAHEAIGKVVMAGLKPEYEVTLFCQGVDALTTELPQLLSSPDTFAPTSSTIGTGNFTSAGPRAVVFGGLWGPEDVRKAQESIKGIPTAATGKKEEEEEEGGEGATGLVFLRNDPALQPGPESGIKMGSPEYSQQIIGRVRGELAKLVPGGPGVGALRSVDGSEGVYWY